MLNQEEERFLKEFHQGSLHRFRELERFATLHQKYSRCQPRADIPQTF